MSGTGKTPSPPSLGWRGFGNARKKRSLGFAFVAVAVMVLSMMLAGFFATDESEGALGKYTSGSNKSDAYQNPYSGIDAQVWAFSSDSMSIFVLKGSPVSLKTDSDAGVDYVLYDNGDKKGSVTANYNSFGLTKNNSNSTITGTLSRTGLCNIIIDATSESGDDWTIYLYVTVVEPINTGSQSNPLSSINWTADDIENYKGMTFYVKVGGSVTITPIGNDSDAGYSVTSVTSGFGLTLDSNYSDGWGQGKVTGTLSKAGTITIKGDWVNGSQEGTPSVTIVAVSSGTPVTSISLSGASTVYRNSTVTITAYSYPSSATDHHVTWEITSGSSYATIQSTSDNSSGGKCILKGVAAGSVTVKATATDGSGVSQTKTITVRNPVCTLYYDENGGSGAPSSESYTTTSGTANHSFTVSSIQPTRSGYKFLGWADNESDTTPKYQPGGKVSVVYNQSKTIYAVWEEVLNTYTATLTFNANGGSGAPSQMSDSITASTASGSKTFTIPSTKPVKSGFDFLGWSTSSTATSASYQPGGTVSVAYGKSTTLYAVWKAVTYTSTLIFSANGGTNAPDTMTYTQSTTSAHTFTIPSKEPSKLNFVFKGWAESSSATTAQYHAGSTIIVAYNGTKTLYAVWEEAKWEIVSEPATKTLKVGQEWNYEFRLTYGGVITSVNEVEVSGADWLSVVDGMTITGTPTKAGTYTVTVSYGYLTQTFELKVYSELGFDSLPGASGVYAYAE